MRPSLRLDTGRERISAIGTDFEQRPDRDAAELFDGKTRSSPASR
jgi:hypothetical protein